MIRARQLHCLSSIALACSFALNSSPVHAQSSATPATGPAPQAATPEKNSATAVADPLMSVVEEAIDITRRRELDGRLHTPWQIIHGVLGMRQDFMIKVDGERMSAIDWISTRGATYGGEPYFEVTEFGGRGHPYTKPMLFEGHPTQFLAYLTVCRLPLEHTIKTGEKTLTIQQIVQGAQKEVKTGEEPAWTLWAMVHYLGVDATWENRQGEHWSIERLVRSQVYENVNTAACGGTHGLFALAYAVQQYRSTGRPLRGIWLEADQKLRRYTEEARMLQSPDGSFSVDFFKGRRMGRTIDERLGASGHTLEFLMVALPEERLREQWVRNGVQSVAKDLIDSRSQSLSVAPLYHAVDGLHIFKERTLSKSLPAGNLVGTSPTAAPVVPVSITPPAAAAETLAPAFPK